MGKKLVIILLSFIPALSKADMESLTKNILLPCGVGILAARAIAPDSNDAWAVGCIITLGGSEAFKAGPRGPTKEQLEIRLKEVESRPALPSL